MENIIKMPEKFPEVIRDFLVDLSVTFPEYKYLWECWLLPSNDISELYHYCLTVYPERFFDILYQNDEIFSTNSEINTLFLPTVVFKMLFSLPDISENTKKTMWKYLQLVLITIMGNIQSSASFGEAASLFEGIDETELQNKLAETVNGLSDFFKGMQEQGQGQGQGQGSDAEQGGCQGARGEGEGASNYDDFAKKMAEEMPDMQKTFEKMFDATSNLFEESANSKPSFNFDDAGMPNVDDLHGHIKGLFDGKIGSLAKELAEELSGDVMHMFDDGTGEIKSTGDIFKKMMKNPKQIMELVKHIGSKLDDKMKNGNISQEEIMKEAGDLMSKMKGMGNGKQFQDMMKTMMKGMGGPMADMMGKGAKMDMGKMNAALAKNTHRERMLKKLEEKRNQANQTQMKYVIEQSKNPNEFVFKLPDEEGVQEKSSAVRPSANASATVNANASATANANASATVNDDWLDEPISANPNPNPNSKPKSKKGKKGKK